MNTLYYDKELDFDDVILLLKQNGVLTTVDVFMLNEVPNKKDRMALLTLKYKQWQNKNKNL